MESTGAPQKKEGGKLNSNIWFSYHRQESFMYKCKFFCFNHAGGDSNIFMDWIKFDENIEVIPVEILGRRKRLREKCRTDFYRLTEDIAEQVIKDAEEDRIFVYGHSLGAILAFGVVSVLERTYHKNVEGLFVAGRFSPTDADPSPYRTRDGIDSLWKELVRIDDTAKPLLYNESFMKFYMPKVYSDYQLAEDYSYDGIPVHSPVYALCGNRDVLTRYGTMKNWSKVTNETFVYREFEGGHFFPYQESAEDVRKFIKESIRECI